jgi:methionyl-tRNA formyltransferase
MKILYASRQFNRSGYEVLKYLINHSTFIPHSVLLPFINANSKLDDEISSVEEIDKYLQETSYFDCKPLRFLESIKLLAKNAGINVIEIESIKNDNSYQLLKELDFDLMVIGGGWPERLPARIIRLPSLGIINTHPSLLPQFRGTDIHRWQVLMNVKTSGVTIHYVDESLDTGDIIGQSCIQIDSHDSPQELFMKVSAISGVLMHSIIKKIENAEPKMLNAAPQLDRMVKSKYFSAWKWDDKGLLCIDWQKSALDLWRLVLAATQESYKYNGPYFDINGHTYILREADIVDFESAALCGDILVCDGDILIKCGDTSQALKLIKIQPINMDNWYTGYHMAPSISSNELLLRENLKTGDNILNIDIKG